MKMGLVMFMICRSRPSESWFPRCYPRQDAPKTAPPVSTIRAPYRSAPGRNLPTDKCEGHLRSEAAESGRSGSVVALLQSVGPSGPVLQVPTDQLRGLSDVLVEGAGQLLPQVLGQ